MQTRLINYRLFIAVTHHAAELEFDPAFTLFYDKNRGVEHYQRDDDNRDN